MAFGFLCLPFPSRLINVFDFEGEFADRSVGTQGGFQAAGTCVAIAFGLVGGAIVGESYWRDCDLILLFKSLFLQALCKSNQLFYSILFFVNMSHKNDLTRPLSLSFVINNSMRFFFSFFIHSGLILKIPIWGDPADDNCYDDEVYWEVRMPFHRKVELFSLEKRSRAF